MKPSPQDPSTGSSCGSWTVYIPLNEAGVNEPVHSVAPTVAVSVRGGLKRDASTVTIPSASTVAVIVLPDPQEEDIVDSSVTDTVFFSGSNAPQPLAEKDTTPFSLMIFALARPFDGKAIESAPAIRLVPSSPVSKIISFTNCRDPAIDGTTLAMSDESATLKLSATVVPLTNAPVESNPQTW